MMARICHLCLRSIPTLTHVRITYLAILLGLALVFLSGAYTGRIVERIGTYELRMSQQQRLLDGWSRVLIHDKLRPSAPAKVNRLAAKESE